MPAPPHDLGRRAHDPRQRDPLPHPARRVRAGGRRDPRHRDRARVRRRRRGLLRHGRDDGQDLPHRRLRTPDDPHLRGGPGLPEPQGERPPGPHTGHRDGGDRGRRRVHRGGGRDGPAQRRPGERGGRPWPRVLRPGRRAADGDGRRRRARAHRPGGVRGGFGQARPGAGGPDDPRGGRGAPRSHRPARRPLRLRDGRREHGERGPGPRRRVGEGHFRPDDDRVRRRRSPARGPPRPEARREPRDRADRSGGRVRDRDAARRGVLRGGAKPLSSPRRLRPRGGQRPARGDARGGAGGGGGRGRGRG